MIRVLKEFQEALTGELLKINSSVSISATENGPLNGIDFETAYKDIDRTKFRKTLGMFKNPKSFFEKNEKKLMADELEKLLHGPAGDYLEKENARMKHHYLPELEREFAKVQKDFSEQITEYFEGITSALDDNFSIESVRTALMKIKNYQ